ncbi:MAG TPA: transketolase [Elusimicrobia bacterium]|nr:transketolase [Elusimicrobiota bacterium]
MSMVKKAMRDVFLERIYSKMSENRSLFFLTADFGSPKLDALRRDFNDRFINVGIAEQNLVNVATGLALEGFTVYAYAIAPFLIMRAYEQIRNNLSLLSHVRDINVNLIGVGAGLSYDVSGPTHHSLEDISIIRTLPNVSLISPSDWVLAERFVDYSIENITPKYIRFDGKPLPNIYTDTDRFNLNDGFFELSKGGEICLVSTGYMTHTALRVAEKLRKEGIHAGVVDIFIIKPMNEMLFAAVLARYKHIVTLEEAFIDKGGLDSFVNNILNKQMPGAKVKSKGFKDSYVFDVGGRDYLHKLNHLDEDSIVAEVKEILK